MKREYKKLVKAAEDLGWTVNINKSDFTFSMFSPAGQDFNIELTADSLEEVISELKERIDSFDCSEETYLWLDSSGHGIKGAPYDMKDLYEDMEACLEMMEELYDALAELE